MTVFKCCDVMKDSTGN